MAAGTTNVGFEEKLWTAADKLRSNMDAAEYKHLLRKYKYPPEQAKNAIETVIKQAELMSSNIEL